LSAAIEGDVGPKTNPPVTCDRLTRDLGIQMKQVELVPIDPSGGLPTPLTPLPKMLTENCEATATFYKVVGFQPPWIGYVSLFEGRAVGGGGFKGPPRDNRVEIAYYTLPEFEGRGFASATARALVRIAKMEIPGIVVAAQTLPTPNASNTLLKNLGFTFKGSLVHPEDGEVWEWQLKRV
jgi:hypothetical protein